MEKKKFSKLNMTKKILSITAKILYDLLILFCIFLIIIVAWQRITDSNKSVYGYRLFRIISGSMVPEYNIDEIVVCKDIDVNNIKVGDVVVYRGRIGELNNKLIMHKVVDINQQDHGLTFHVKGIQNTASDPNVQSGQIVGKVVFKSQFLTHIYSLATSLYSSFFIVIVLVINVFVSFRPGKKEVMKLNEHNENDDIVDNINNTEESKRYTLKNYDKDIKIIKQHQIKDEEEKEKKIQNILKEIEEAEKIKAENKRLQEENKKLKEKVEKSKKTKKQEDKKEIENEIEKETKSKSSKKIKKDNQDDSKNETQM